MCRGVDPSLQQELDQFYQDEQEEEWSSDEQEDPAESLRSVASEWLGSVLQTLPKQK